MSQGELAKTVGLSPSEISRIECGYRDISPKEAQAIAVALGMVPPVTPVVAERLSPPPRDSVVPCAGACFTRSATAGRRL